MELSVQRRPDLVVALDIGSTYSGYAWQWRSNFERNRSNIEFNEHWGTGAPRLRKTTTCLLLGENQEVDSFGQLAEKRFCKALGREDADSLVGKMYFFKGFKLVLYNQEGSDLTTIQVDDYFGKPVPLMDVMTKFIGALRISFLSMMERKNQFLNPSKVLWVVTVPAIWPDAAKKFMSSAAERCGIKRKNLLISIEPEAASIHCIHLPNEERIAMGSLGEKGDTFLTVDLGGGTTDVLALHVRDDGMLEEVSMGSGGLVGGNDVNNAFFQSFHDAFKGNIWSKVSKESNAIELYEMENDFESKKVEIGLDNTSEEEFMLSMPDEFQNLLDSGEIQLTESELTKNRFRIIRKKFHFSSAFIRESLFNETVRRILDVLREILRREQVQSINKIVLIGGFTESPIVVGKIKDFLGENFPGKKLFIPTSPLTAVLSGAVLFGHDPFIFYSRICRATYGVGTNHPFDASIHREDKKWTNEDGGKDWCKDVFDIHVEKGHSVKLGVKQPSKIYFPVYKNQKLMKIPIYMSDVQHPVFPAYTTDEDCRRIGEIIVESPDTTAGIDRKVAVTMIYGGTELDVTAKDETSGLEFKATLRFDSS